MSETGGDGDDTFVPFAVRTRPPLQLSVREEVVAEKALQQHASNAGDDDVIQQRQQTAAWPEDLGWKVEDAYAEVLDCVVRAIGCQDLAAQSDAICGHLRAVFGFDEFQHQQLLDAVQQRPPPPMSLQVDILKARNLRGKDINGLSDPYCIVSVPNGLQEEQLTGVQSETLDPVWNERFTMSIQDKAQDYLLVEVMDYDPEESVRDKMSRIGQVKSARGFTKFFKEIAGPTQSNAHDYLGKVSVPLRDVPIVGDEQWLHLADRVSQTTKQRGELLVKMTLLVGAQDEARAAQSRSLYELCLRTFMEHELKLDQWWTGQLGASSSLVLRQLAAQRGLSPAAVDVASWSAYTSFLGRRTLDFDALRRLLKRLDGVEMSDELAGVFWTAAERFVGAALDSVRRLRTDPELDEDPTNLTALLHCLALLEGRGRDRGEMADLASRVADSIVAGAADWWSRALESAQRDDPLENAVDIVQFLIGDLRRVLRWPSTAFQPISTASCFSLVYRFYDGRLATLCRPLVDAASDEIETSELSDGTVQAISADQAVDGDPKMKTGTSLFELYVGLQQFHKLSSELAPSTEEGAGAGLQLDGHHLWFSVAAGRWLNIALLKATVRIGRAVQLDEFKPIDPLVRHSSSAVDVVSVLYQVKIFWDQLAWPESEFSLGLLLRILADITRSCAYYTEVLSSRIFARYLTLSDDAFHACPSLCVAINNVEHIRESIRPLAERLGAADLCRSLRRRSDAADADAAADATDAEQKQEAMIATTLDAISAKMDEIFYLIAVRIETQVDRILKQNWNGTISDTLDELVHYLDGNLSMLNSNLETATFERLLKQISCRVLNLFHNLINLDIQSKRRPERFRQWENLMKVMTDFFYGAEYADNQDESLAKVQRLVFLNGAESDYLAHHYLLGRLAQQTNVQPEEAGRGVLTVRVAFVEDQLVVDVLNGRDLLKMDTTGSADPYVKVQLVTGDKPVDEAPTFKTAVQKNTLLPLFDETFTFDLAAAERTEPGHVLWFTVRDHDMLTPDDFMGDAFLSLAQIASADGRQIHLTLSRPTDEDEPHLKVLTARTWDDGAQKFARKEIKKIRGA